MLNSYLPTFYLKTVTIELNKGPFHIFYLLICRKSCMFQEIDEANESFLTFWYKN